MKQFFYTLRQHEYKHIFNIGKGHKTNKEYNILCLNLKYILYLSYYLIFFNKLYLAKYINNFFFLYAKNLFKKN